MRGRSIRRAVLPLTAFVLTVAAHVAYHIFFPESAPEQSRWASVPTAGPGLVARYIESQSYFLGLSYASSLAFAVAAFRRYRERRLCSDRTIALGSVTLSGVLAVVGCFLLGCCGSPMLGVYLSLLGPWFLPWRGPMTLAVTLAALAGGAWWMHRRERRQTPTVACCAGSCEPTCAEPARSEAPINAATALPTDQGVRSNR